MWAEAGHAGRLAGELRQGEGCPLSVKVDVSGIKYPLGQEIYIA